jgi:hypothetical protein
VHIQKNPDLNAFQLQYGAMGGLFVDTVQGLELRIPAFGTSSKFKQYLKISRGFPFTTEATTFRRRFTTNNLTLSLHRPSLSGNRIARCLQWRLHLAGTFPVLNVSN